MCVSRLNGHQMIPTQLVKDVAAAIAEPLTSIFNYSIENCYPANWKMGTVTPLFKKDDELCKVNYRPVTVLPALKGFWQGRRMNFILKFFQTSLALTGNFIVVRPHC